MNKDKLEYLAKQAIERMIACLASFNLEKSFVEQSVYSDDAELVECLADYYVFVLDLQRGLLLAGDEPIEKYSCENLTEGVGGRKLLYL